MKTILAELADAAGQIWRLDYGAGTFANAWRQLRHVLPLILFGL